MFVVENELTRGWASFDMRYEVEKRVRRTSLVVDNE